MTDTRAEPARPLSGVAVRVFLLFALLAGVLVKFVPFYPSMPAAGLDPSWTLAINRAVAERLSFGKDMIWVFGPYASAYTHAYYPGVFSLTLAATLYLALSYWACLVLLMRDVQLRWIIVYCLALSGIGGWPDALLFSLPLLIGLVTYKALRPTPSNWAKSKMAPIYIAALFFPLGLLPLVKGSMLALSIAVIVLCSLLFIADGDVPLATACVASPLVAAPILWVVSGQSVRALPGYLVVTAGVVAGWTQAFSFSPPFTSVRGVVYSDLELILFLLSSAIILFVILRHRQLTTTSRVFVGALFFVVLFLAFKAAYVFHDDHAVIAGETVLLAAALFLTAFSTVLRPALVALVVVLALGAYGLPEVHYVYLLGRGMPEDGYAAAWRGITNSVKDPNWRRREFESAMSSLRAQAHFPALKGNTDIYSYDQAYLIASGNKWSPRPVLQSHTAYTPALAEIDRQHLLGAEAPDNIIFAVQPILGRLPSLDDGPSWPELLRHYRPWSMQSGYLFLRKTTNAGASVKLSTLDSETGVLGSSVQLPSTRVPLFAQIDIKPTILGTLSDVVFKPTDLRITLKLADGTQKQYRLVAGMAKAGFMISPLVENTADFGKLYGEGEGLDGKHVESFTVEQTSSWVRFMPSDWQNQYVVTLSQLK